LPPDAEKLADGEINRFIEIGAAMYRHGLRDLGEETAATREHWRADAAGSEAGEQ